MDARTQTEIRRGHRRLLATFRALAREVVDDSASRADPDALRGLDAFLRQEIAPFARREEDALVAGAPRESTAFEHAFLAAEIDAFSRAVEKWFATVAGELNPDGPMSAHVIRRLHRIEAVLELHVLKGEDDTAAPFDPDGSGRWDTVSRSSDGEEGSGGARRPRELSADEVNHILRRHQWGILATDEGGRPYAVPVAYGYDGRHIYVATLPGRKAEAIERNPAVCFTVVRVEDAGVRWRSVVLSGRAECITDPLGRLRAFHVLRRQQNGSGRRSVRDARRLARARVVRIVPSEATGRAVP